MMTSCSPGWIKFIEHFYPGQLGHISTCKSPQQMFGALAKSYWVERWASIPARSRSSRSCPVPQRNTRREDPKWSTPSTTGKEDEAEEGRGLLRRRLRPDDPELARMFKQAGVDFSSLASEDFDHPLGKSTGAAVIFGATGGVMEAALRTAYEVVVGKPFPR
jgi:NADH-quinone oxidoreductase subunit G/NADP-reducing hydrogenase subunit HndD